MPAIPTISFVDEPVAETGRRLDDLPDRVIDGDPRHLTKLYFESPDRQLIAGT
ncbi:MAG TPA: hypothetical protein VKB27_11625 [Gammaproteobacteria bacterium]|nr:hypothetical protein [Gammaproteobacteria bacterium]